MRKKIAFVGNMNNMPYMFSKEMRNQGTDVTLYVDAPAENKLDRPEAYDRSLTYPYPHCIKEIKHRIFGHFVGLRAAKFLYGDLIDELNAYDTVILNGNWITLAPYLKPDLQIYSLCAGFEVDGLADPENIDGLVASSIKKRPWLLAAKPLLMLFYKRVIRQHRAGLARSEGINYYPTGISERGDSILAEVMGQKPYRRLELRGFPEADFPFTEPDLKKETFTILNFTRFFFANDRLDNKRNDIMLDGIGLFFEATGRKDDVEIILFEKGDEESIAKAKELIDKWDFASNVTWQNEVSQEELFGKFVPRCDVAFDQLGDQWIGAGAFVMMAGRPLIANGRPEVFEPLTSEVSPVCQATTPEDVCFWLKKLYENRSEVRRIGVESRAYVQKHYDICKTIEFFLQGTPV